MFDNNICLHVTRTVMIRTPAKLRSSRQNTLHTWNLWQFPAIYLFVQRRCRRLSQECAREGRNQQHVVFVQVCTADRREPTPVFVPGKRNFGRVHIRAPPALLARRSRGPGGPWPALLARRSWGPGVPWPALLSPCWSATL